LPNIPVGFEIYSLNNYCFDIPGVGNLRTFPETGSEGTIWSFIEIGRDDSLLGATSSYFFSFKFE
jgi:hypothetical protein